MRLAPKGSHLSGSGARASGPNLQSSIFDRIESGDERIDAVVGSEKDYAATAHQGSKPHVIRMKGKLLRFEWERGQFLLKRRGKRGRGYFLFAKVNHPGNKRPVRYLTTPLHLFGRMNGFRTTSTPVSRSRLP